MEGPKLQDDDYDRVVHVHDSDAFYQVAYRFDGGRLRIWFVDTNSVWVYSDVPIEVFAELVAAPSMGEIFNYKIRATYETQRVHPKVHHDGA